MKHMVYLQYIYTVSIMNIWHTVHMILFSPDVPGILEWLLQQAEWQQVEAVLSMSVLTWVRLDMFKTIGIYGQIHSKGQKRIHAL